MRTSLTPLLALALVLAGCVGQVGSPPLPDEMVASLTLNADSVHVLSAKECTDSTCGLPNNRDCTQMVIDVYGDGHTVADCTLQGGQVIRLTNPRDIPMVCRSNKDRYSVQCMDVRDNLAVDVTDTSVHIYPGRTSQAYHSFLGTGIVEGSGYLMEEGDDANGTPSTPTQPPDTTVTPPSGGNANDADCAKHAKAWFNKTFNDALHKEGLAFGYKPSGVGSTNGFFNNGEYQCNPAELCTQTNTPPCDAKAMQQGRCYCWESQFGPTCKGAPMVDAALAEACAKRPPNCDSAKYAMTVWDESRAAINWIQANNQTTDNKQDAANAAAITTGALAAAAGIGALLMLADPLVLDLDGDGVALTSAKDGALFDMSGAGAVRTAWVRGKDDALLCIDLNGNGVIDSGAELFSDAFLLNGRRARDGFEALALADSPRNSGNGDGRVDSSDALYNQLMLWRDVNGDGVSQSDELSDLRSAGVEALGTQSRHESSTDEHGNDLSTRGSFFRNGQPQLMVDANLRTAR